MKRFFLSLVFITCIFKVNAQSSSTYVSHTIYFNKFQGFQETNVDSAVYYIEKLFAEKSFVNVGIDLLHDSFGQNFIAYNQMDLKDPKMLEQMKKRDFYAHAIIKKLIIDSNVRLRTSVLPIYMWTEAQKYSSNPKMLEKIGEEYISKVLYSDNLFEDRKGRYGLLICGILANKPTLASLSNKLFYILYDNLMRHQVNPDSIKTGLDKNRRTWYRYLYAYSNYFQAVKFAKLNDKPAAEKYYKLAYEFSPDNLDNSNKSAFFYDMIFLLGAENYTFEDDYLAFLNKNGGDFADKLKVSVGMSFKDPSYKEQAKVLYQSKYAVADFSKYWLDGFNQEFKAAPAFVLTKLDGSVFSLTENKGKWILIDFWGTWCSPCREEHPDLQKLYLATMDGKMPKLDIITIGSYDKEDNVRNYMQQMKYNFPVAMSDNLIENSYAVSSWPSKFLISPQGKFVIIPFNVDWVKYVKDYIN